MTHKVVPWPSCIWSQWTFPGSHPEDKFLHTQTKREHWTSTPQDGSAAPAAWAGLREALLPAVYQLDVLSPTAAEESLLDHPGHDPSRVRNPKEWPCWRAVTTQWLNSPCPCGCFADNPAHFLLTYVRVHGSRVFSSLLPSKLSLSTVFPQSPVSKQIPEILFCLKDNISLPFTYRIPKATSFHTFWLPTACCPLLEWHTTVTSAWEEVGLPLAVPNPSRQHSALLSLCPPQSAVSSSAARRAQWGEGRQDLGAN